MVVDQMCAATLNAATAAAAGGPIAETRAVVAWNLTALEVVAVSNGVREGHDLALAQAAVFDAVTSIRPRYAPYRVRVHAGATR